MRWKPWFVLALFVGGAFLGAHLLQRYRNQEVERGRSSLLERLDEAYREKAYPTVVEIANSILGTGTEFEDRAEVLRLKAEALTAVGARNAGEVWSEILEKYAGGESAARAHLALATSSLEGGDNAAALRHLRSVVEGFPGSSFAEKAQGLIAGLEKPTPKPSGASGQQERQPAAPRPTAKPAATARPADRTQPQQGVAGREAILASRGNAFNELYQVKPGDTLYALAASRLVTVELLQALNPGADSDLKVGQSIVLPKEGGVRVGIDLSSRTLTMFSNRKGTEGQPLLRFSIGLTDKPERHRPGKYTAGPRLIRYDRKPNGEYGELGSRWIELRSVDDPQMRLRVAVHGTNAPATLDQLAPRNAIRMRNEDIEVLFLFVNSGTPFEIEE